MKRLKSLEESLEAVRMETSHARTGMAMNFTSEAAEVMRQDEEEVSSRSKRDSA